MPLHFERVIIGIAGDPVAPTVIETTVSIPVVKLDLDQDGDNDIEIKWGDNIGLQMHEGDEHELSFLIHILQGAPQGETGTLKFYVKLEAVQFNESIHPVP